LKKRTHLIGKTVADINALAEGQMLIIALQRADGSILRSGFMEQQLDVGDSLIIIARTPALPQILRTEMEGEDDL
jgi:Trk K+ transport system NAD-binding subunit